MKRKKKITVSYLERDSKKHGLQGYCRIVHNGKSTMFNISSSVELLFEDPKTWFDRNQKRIVTLLGRERDIVGDEFEIKGFHNRFVNYNTRLASFLTWEHIMERLQFDFWYGGEILSEEEVTQVFDLALDNEFNLPLSIGTLYTLLSTDFGQDRNKLVIEAVNDFVDATHTFVFQLYSLVHEAAGFSPITCWDYAINPDEVITGYDRYCYSSGVEMYKKVLKDQYILSRINFIIDKIDIDKALKDFTQHWLKAQYRRMINEIYHEEPFVGDVFQVRLNQ